MSDSGKKVLFVMSGGGLPGLDVHAGIWQALSERGIHATEISGTSAGAIVGAMNAAGWRAESAAEYLSDMTSRYLRQPRTAWHVRLPWIESICKNESIRISLEGVLPPAWNEMTLPLSTWAINKRTGSLVNTARPELSACPVDAVLASMSISGLWPSVRLLDGEQYIDGGMRFNLPLLSSWWDFDEVWLLVASSRPEEYSRNDALSNLIRNLNIMHKGIMTNVIDGVSGDPRVRVIWPDLGGSASMLEFDHTLINRARTVTHLMLDGRMSCQAGR